MAGYNLDFYAESRQHAIAHLAGQGMALEVQTMLAAAIANMGHDGPLHVKASGALADTPDAAAVSMGSFEVSPVNFVDVVPASLPNEAPAVSWKAWLEGKRAGTIPARATVLFGEAPSPWRRHPEKKPEEDAAAEKAAAEAAAAHHPTMAERASDMVHGRFGEAVEQDQTLAEQNAAMARASNQQPLVMEPDPAVKA